MPPTVDEVITATARRFSWRPAILTRDGQCTYGELLEQVNEHARRLRQLGLRRGDRVVVAADKHPSTIALVLAILRLGGAFVPVAPASPKKRLEMILERVQPRFLLADGPPSADGERSRDTHLLWAGEADGVSWRWFSSLAAEPAGRPHHADVAQILFTSGSTGEPKGVVVTHATILAFVRWAERYFRLDSRDRVSGHAPLHFDLSTLDVYVGLSVGAALRPILESENSPSRVARIIDENGLTQWVSVPSMLDLLSAIAARSDIRFPTLERAITCGEPLSASTVRAFARCAPGARFYNLYGPTEATVASTAYEIDVNELPPGPDIVAIGRAIEGEQVEILDATGAHARPDEVGEIVISGSGLSPGYWGDPVQTAGRFFELPDGTRAYRTGDFGRCDAAGMLHFHGRRDRQIKLGGHRIELDEVELAVADLPSVAAAAVLVTEFRGVRRLTCVYVPHDADVSPSALRAFLKEALPEYMRPQEWIAVDEVPRTLSGKLDRRAVAEVVARLHKPDRPPVEVQ